MDTEGIFRLIRDAEHPLSRQDVVAAAGVSDMTAYRRLEDLVKSGRIQRIGAGRATAYCLDAADAWCAIPLEKRKQTGYDFMRLASYTPGVSRHFSEEQRKVLGDCGEIPRSRTLREYIDSIKHKMLLETSWASSALEGNTYSLLDTVALFENGQAKEGASQADTLMLLNHKHAIDYILENIDQIEISRRDVLNIHALLSRGLLKNPEDEGCCRRHGVKIGQSSYTPLDVQSMLNEEFDRLLDIARQIEDPFEQSFFLLVNISYLQPFADVNKRTSRLVSNIPLLKANLAPMSFYQISRHGYEKGILHFYETGDSRRLAKEYTATYCVSAERFRELWQNHPDQAQLAMVAKFRREIVSMVREIVLGGSSPEEMIDSAAVKARLTDEEEGARLREYVSRAVDSLHEGNLVIYGITPQQLTEFRATGAPSPAKRASPRG